MNIQEFEIIKQLYLHAFSNQRKLAASCRCSLGMINRCLQSLESLGYLTEEKQLTPLSMQLVEDNKPQRAVILAAGSGMRMIPVNMEQPKAMLDVYGEILIERLIRQLHEVGIQEIYVVVGFMKESFEYLIDDFGVKLIVNRNYADYNNLHSLALTRDKLSNAYILPSDIWCRDNPFNRAETYSWYMVTDSLERDSEVRVGRQMELFRISKSESGNAMVGISYISAKDGPILQKNVDLLCQNFLYDHAFWEEALYQCDKMITFAKVVPYDGVLEINTYGQLLDLKMKLEQRENIGLALICQTFGVKPEQIQDRQPLKKGLTNQSFLYTCKQKRYVLRVPTAIGNVVVNRDLEKAAYDALCGKRQTDDLIAIDSVSGCKISRYMEGSRGCDAENTDEVCKAMALLRSIHRRKLKVPAQIDLFEKIESFERLRQGQPSAYRDYEQTKRNIFSLHSFLAELAPEYSLTHMDVSPDNFLFYEDNDGLEQVRLIDWEFAGMQDPHVDIAMFCISALYNKDQADKTIDLYFENRCPEETRIKIYCYMAVCGLMWSNWCEYQLHNGVEFGQYSLMQYRYAKEYYRLVSKWIEKNKKKSESER